MYKHLNNILEKNHIRNSRRKESLAKRTKTEMFGTKYELKKSEKQKQLHEMTRKEYETQYGKPKKSTTVTGGFHPHKEAVETAINRGIKISEHILADYPEFKSDIKKSEKTLSLQKGESKLSVIGTTSSKKNVYDSFNHPEHKNFTAKDHEEAAKIHRGRINTKMSSRKADSIRHQEYMHANWAKTLREQ